jgi:hypothetical protein
VNSGRSRRGTGVSAWRERGENGVETGYRDLLDGGVRRREDGGVGFRVVRDCSLIHLCAIASGSASNSPNAMPTALPIAGRAILGTVRLAAAALGGKECVAACAVQKIHQG